MIFWLSIVISSSSFLFSWWAFLIAFYFCFLDGKSSYLLRILLLCLLFWQFFLMFVFECILYEKGLMILGSVSRYKRRLFEWRNFTGRGTDEAASGPFHGISQVSGYVILFYQRSIIQSPASEFCWWVAEYTRLLAFRTQISKRWGLYVSSWKE